MPALPLLRQLRIDKCINFIQLTDGYAQLWITLGEMLYLNHQQANVPTCISSASTISTQHANYIRVRRYIVTIDNLLHIKVN